MLDQFRRLDAFPKTIDDFRVKTVSGALVSILSMCLMLLLFSSELFYYMSTTTVDHLFVNTSSQDTLKVSFDITFHQIPCSLLSIDAYDDLGNPQTNIHHEIYKHKISINGEKDPMVVTQELGNTIQTEKELEDLVKNQLQKDETEPVAKCGNCYGAGAPGECCNSCDDVKAAYTRYGWKFNPQGIAQCRREALKDTIESERATDGGCRLYGLLDLDKAAGHFHIAPHKQAHKEKAEANPILTLLDFINYTFDQFNITHTVNSLEFGHQFPGIKSPLDSQLRTLQDTHAMYQYYMKIVPTRYKNSKSGREIESNQYSVTEHMRHLAPGSGRGVPGVYFNYELAPIQAIYEEKQPINFSSFLTSVCAIVGGVFTVLGLLDKFIIDVANIFSAGLL